MVTDRTMLTPNDLPWSTRPPRPTTTSPPAISCLTCIDRGCPEHRDAAIRLQLWRPSAVVATDLAEAARLHTTWWASRAEPAQGALKDSADLMYGYPADILRCPECGSLYRDPGSIPGDIQARYREDPYPPATLERLWNSYARSYEQDQAWMRRQLATGGQPVDERPRLLEIGSHVGALLAYADQAGWRAHGWDVGAAVTAYARSRGVDARQGAFDPDEYGPASLNAVWILNCFEHLPDPGRFLVQLASILRPGGRLILRTPRAEGITTLYRARPRRLARMALTVENTLGVPFPRCYSQGALRALVLHAGFDLVEQRGRRLVSVAPASTSHGRLAQLRAAARAHLVDAGMNVWGRLPDGDSHTWMDLVAVRRHDPIV